MFEHFLAAQASPTAGYAAALAELEPGRKTGHWIWYVFPQLAGLSRSDCGQRFAIAGYQEAMAYLADPVLGPRLSGALQAVMRQIETPHGRVLLVGLMGGKLDAQKLVSSCTLFGYSAQLMLRDKDKVVAERALEVATLCREIQEVAEKQGLPPDLVTLDAMPDGLPCDVCGGHPSMTVGSSVAPCSYGRCLKCQQEMMEAEFIFELVHQYNTWPEYIERVWTLVDGKKMTWLQWQRFRGLPIRFVEALEVRE